MAVQTHASADAEAREELYTLGRGAGIRAQRSGLSEGLSGAHRANRTGLSGRSFASALGAAACISLLLGGCSGNSGEASGSSSLGLAPTAGASIDEDGAGTVEATVASGPVVATLELEAPGSVSFILRATMPVPPGTLGASDQEAPFSVLNADGLVAPTQVEIVSMYADTRQGADVVELIARVSRPLDSSPGSRVRFDVARNPHAAKDLRLLPSVRNFFDGADRLILQTRDVFGNLYTADLFHDVKSMTGEAKVQRKGELVKEFMTHEIMLPRAPDEGAQGTMPHMMGVHSFIRFYEGEEYFALDLHVHNGLSGLDKNDPADDALMDIYFDSLELRLPQGWRVLEAFDTPFGGPGRDQAPHRVYPLVRAQGNGNMHMMPRQSRMVRRLVVAPAERQGRAREVVEERHQAFCVAGTTPTGADNFSWWNPLTARYYPQNHRLPSLDHVGLAAIRQQHRDDLGQIMAQVASGSAGLYPLTEPMLGWAHPWGVAYGGMTGGDEIWLYDGIETAAASSNAGYRRAQLVSRLYIDREPIALFNKDGQPTRDIDWLRPEGINGPYMPMYFTLTPKLPDNDPFGFNDAPVFQTQAVLQTGRRPGYADRLTAFKPVDFQHFVRYTRNLKTLTWLGNDSLSKLELQLDAELFRLGFHMYPNSNYNHIQNSGLLARTLFVDAYPNQGIGFGRGESWALDAAMAAYATGSTEFRERYYPWFEIVADLVENGQSDCSGIIQAWQSTNYLGSQYRLRQSYETAITENMLRSLTETVFRSEDDERAERVEQIMVRSARGNTRAPYWSPTEHAPWNFMAVGPFDNEAPLYCGDVPEGAHSPNFDRNQYWSSLAYAFEISGDELFVFRAAEMAGGGDLYNHVISGGLGNLGNMAALIALMQEDRGIE
ncbi:MAG: hypothetical protein ACI8QZ_004337 [Chlamydiales bacterium]|jgi:hypothetical protein